MSHEIVSHYNHRSEPSFEQRSNSETFSLKTVNNLMKRMLVSEAVDRFSLPNHLSLVVVDLCGGKAGDLRKWLCTGCKIAYYLIDASAIEVERAKQRFQELKPEDKSRFTSAKFICADAFSTDLLLLDSLKELCGKVHIISCQFALHYAYETQSKALQFWSTIARLSQPGSILAISHPRRQRIVEWCRAYSKKRKVSTPENRICSIHFVDPQMEQLIANSESSAAALEATPHYGACYRFTLSDALYQVPEFLLSPTKELHNMAYSVARMRCDFNTTIDQKCRDLRSSKAKEAADLVKTQPISEEEFQVACLYEYSLYKCE